MASKAAFEILLQLNDKASKGMKKAAKEGGFLKNALSFATGGVILKGIEAIGDAAGDMFTGAIDEAREAKRGMSQLEAVLKSTGGQAGITKEEALKLADSLSAAGGLSTATDDAVLAAENMLLTFTNIKKNVFPGATKAALDMATAMNNGVAPSLEDLQSKSVLVGKALNDPIKGITALTRVGVTFTDEQKNMIKALVDTGDTAGAQKIILDELNKEFGGSAEAAAKASGGMAQLDAKMDNLKQRIGEALMPVIDGFVGFLNDTALPSVEGLMTAFSSGDPADFQKAIEGLPEPIRALVSPLGDVAANAGKFFKAVQSGDPEQVLQFWRDLGGPIGFAGENITKLTLGIADFFKGMSGEGSEGANAFWANFNKGVDTANKGLVVAQTEGSKFWRDVLNVQPGEVPFNAAMRIANDNLTNFKARVNESQTSGRAFWESVIEVQPGETPFSASMRIANDNLTNFKARVNESQTSGKDFWTWLIGVNPGETPFQAAVRTAHENLAAFRDRTAESQSSGQKFWDWLIGVNPGETPFQAAVRTAHENLQNFKDRVNASQTAGQQFWAFITGAKSGETPFEAVIHRITSFIGTLIEKARQAINLFRQLLGMSGGGGGADPGGGGGGGGNSGNGGSSSGGFASGGRPPVGTASWVGERGPELFVPDRPGTIIPNHRLAGMAGGGLTVVAHFHAPVFADDNQMIEHIAEKLYDLLQGRS